MEIGQFVAADAELSMALKALPNLSSAYTNKGRIAMAHGGSDDADLFFRRALALNPDDVMALRGVSSLNIAKNHLPQIEDADEAILLVSRLSVHARRSHSIYHEEALTRDDLLPLGLLEEAAADRSVNETCAKIATRSWAIELANKDLQRKRRINSICYGESN